MKNNEIILFKVYFGKSAIWLKLKRISECRYMVEREAGKSIIGTGSIVVGSCCLAFIFLF